MVDAAALAALRADPAMAPLRRSLDYYYRQPRREAAMDRLYRRFAAPATSPSTSAPTSVTGSPGCRRLGVRVVALEPQPLCARALRALYAVTPG